MDWTPTKEANRKAWLGTAVAKNFVVSAVFGTCSATAITVLLGMDFKGINNFDRCEDVTISHPIYMVLGTLNFRFPSNDRFKSTRMSGTRKLLDGSTQGHVFTLKSIQSRRNRLEGLSSQCEPICNSSESIASHGFGLSRFEGMQSVQVVVRSP